MKYSKDLYEILQVHPAAHPEVIKAAYRRLALEYHPDRNTAPGATARMAEINQAHDVLSDPARRVEYDRYRAAQAGRRETREDTPPRTEPPPPNPQPQTQEDCRVEVFSASRLLWSFAVGLFVVCAIGTILTGVVVAWGFLMGKPSPGAGVATLSVPWENSATDAAEVPPVVSKPSVQPPPAPRPPTPPATPLPALQAPVANASPASASIQAPVVTQVLYTAQAEPSHLLSTNRRATGAPAISGVARVGETLTMSPSGISDGDGMTNANFSYQWTVNDGTTDRLIPGAIAPSYTIRHEDVGSTLGVIVNFTDDVGNDEFMFSDRTGPVGGPPVDNRYAGTVTLSTSTPGEILVVWIPPIVRPRDYRISWARADQDFPSWRDVDGNAISVSTSHTITGLEQGQHYKVRVRPRYEDASGDWSKSVEAIVSEEEPRSRAADTSIATDSPMGVEPPTGDATSTVIVVDNDQSILTGELRDGPMTHNGVDAFTLRAAFSEPIAIGYKTLRDHSFDVYGGSITKARRVNSRRDLWELTIAPNSSGDILVTLGAGRTCAVQGAVCTKDRRRLMDRLELIVPGVDG